MLKCFGGRHRGARTNNALPMCWPQPQFHRLKSEDIKFWAGQPATRSTARHLWPSTPWGSNPISPTIMPCMGALWGCRVHCPNSTPVSSFAWGCAQQRVEEPHSVPGYRVRLPEERSLEQPQEVRSACQPHMHAISNSAHRGGHRSVSLCRRTVEDRLPLERVPLACTFGSPLDLHVRQCVGRGGGDCVGLGPPPVA